MSLSIAAVSPGTLANPSTTAPATQLAPAPQSPVDTVELSEYAQVTQLNSQGESAVEIADALGIAVSTVNSDLGIVAAIANSTTAATPATSSASVKSAGAA